MDQNQHFYHRPTGNHICWCHSGCQIDLEKNLNFKPVSKSAKIIQTTAKASANGPNLDFCENMLVATASTRKPCLNSSNCQGFHAELDAKGDLETSRTTIEFKPSQFKSSRNLSPKNSQLTPNLIPDAHVSFALLRCLSIMSQSGQNKGQGARVGTVGLQMMGFS